MKNFESLFDDVFGDNKSKKDKIKERQEIAQQYLNTQMSQKETSKANNNNKRA